jgi:hypothetical protein
MMVLKGIVGEGIVFVSLTLDGSPEKPYFLMYCAFRVFVVNLVSSHAQAFIA